MSQRRTPIRVLIVGMNAEVNTPVVNGVNEDPSFSACGLVISNNVENDAKLIKVIKEEEYDAIVLGKGLRIQQDWFERIENLVKRNTNIPVVEVQGRTPQSVKEALQTIGVI